MSSFLYPVSHLFVIQPCVIFSVGPCGEVLHEQYCKLLLVIVCYLAMQQLRYQCLLLKSGYVLRVKVY